MLIRRIAPITRNWRSVQKFNKLYWRIISWHAPYRNLTSFTEGSSADSKGSTSTAPIKDQHRCSTIFHQLYIKKRTFRDWSQQNGSFSSKEEVKDTDICKEYMWLLSQSPGWNCPTINSYQDEDSCRYIIFHTSKQYNDEFGTSSKRKMNRIRALLTRIIGRNDKAIVYGSLDLPGYPRSATNTATQIQITVTHILSSTCLGHMIRVETCVWVCYAKQ